MSLTEFLLARIAEDEAAARAYPSSEWTAARGGIRLPDSRSSFRIIEDHNAAPTALAHIARWDPARVLAECEAKRRIVEAAWDQAPGECDECHSRGGDHTLNLLALPYADHPDYDPTWRP